MRYVDVTLILGQTKRRKEKKSDELALKQLDYEMKILKEELTDTFVQFFVSILSGYRDFIVDSKMDKDKFVEAQPLELQAVC